MKIAILGVGSWGTALGIVLSENQHDVIMWGREEPIVRSINEEHSNSQYLANVALPPNLRATNDLSFALQDAEMVVFAVPSQAIREVAEKIKGDLSEATTKPLIVHVAKGIERETYLRLSEVIAEVLPPDLHRGIVVLSGPSHAEEVARRDLTTITAASESLQAAREVQEAFMNSYFRVYTNDDVVGVELGGALKNIIAVCAGVLVGLNYGDNAKAALMTRGLAEITRLGVKMGADPLTFSGLAGVGDLIVTCTSVHSRNWRAGNLLAQGYTLPEIEEKIGMVIEGFITVQVAYNLAQQMGVEMPITEMLYHYLYEDLDVTINEAIQILMDREGKKEASLKQ